MRIFAFILFGVMLTIQGCEELFTSAPEENELLDGPIEGLSSSQMLTFLAGDAAFGEVFIPETGLGPYFVTNACNVCHPGDGKGHPSNGLTRFGKFDGSGNFDPLLLQGGPQLQHLAIPGFEAETIPQDGMQSVTTFTAPGVTGLGFLEAVTDADIIAMSDPNDLNGDGISGVPNYITPPDFFEAKSQHIPDSQGRYIGRFGKKAGALNLLMQTVGAYKQDMGITSDFDPIDPINYAVSDMPLGQADDPEVSASTVNNVVFYLSTLKAPIRRNEEDSNVQKGEMLFDQINCTTCHRPTLMTGAHPVKLLADKEIHPYTDLLMHDMGAGLDDNYTEGTATSAEWKTPALWGLGLSKDAQGGKYFLLHDGRAHSLEEAIVMHGGEAATSSSEYQALSEENKNFVIQFLESL